jgi:hypothetical protein
VQSALRNSRKAIVYAADFVCRETPFNSRFLASMGTPTMAAATRAPMSNTGERRTATPQSALLDRSTQAQLANDVA